MIQSIRQGFIFARENDARTVWREFNRRDNRHPLIQFCKYACCGVLATVVHNLTFGLLGWSGWLPHFASQGLPADQRALYFLLASLGGFLVSNAITYLVNVHWVFEGGRHGKLKEFLFFTTASAIGFVVGCALGTREILLGSGSSWIASLSLVLCSTLVNFATRKFLIFRA
jgi:putative flippase GtrA